MNKASRIKLALIGPIVVLILVLVVLVVPGISANGPALVINSPEGPCIMFTPSLPITVTVPASHLVITMNTDELKKGKTHLKCETTFNDPPPNAIQFDRSNTDSDCTWTHIENGTKVEYFTIEWQQVISASGNSTLTCHFN